MLVETGELIAEIDPKIEAALDVEVEVEAQAGAEVDHSRLIAPK